MAVPEWPHDTTAQIQLDVIDTVFDLFADRFDESMRSITLSGMSSGDKVASSSSEKIAAC